MLCSECARHVRPVVALDIDGTEAMYHESLLEFAERWLGSYVAPRYDGSVKLAKWMGISDDTYRAMKLAYRQGGFKRWMPMYSDAWDLAPTLVNAGIEVWFTTTRPYNRFDSTDPDTREWLRRNVGEYGTHYHGLIYDDHKYDRLLETVGPNRVIGVVDDLPEQYQAAELLGLSPLLVRRQHNQHHNEGHIVESLHQARNVLLERADGWRRASS